MDCAVSTVFYILPWHIAVATWYGALYSAAQSYNIPAPALSTALYNPLFLDPARGAAVLRHHGLEPQAGYPGGGEQRLATSLGGCPLAPPGGQPPFPHCHETFSPPLRSQSGSAFAGHIGVGHVNSHQGFVQDDAAGFAALLALLLRICPLDMTVTAICTDGDRLTVSLACGGQGQASLPGGFSPL